MIDTKCPQGEISHRTFLRLAGPMALVYLSVPLVGLADTALIGQLGNAALQGAVAIAAILFDLVFVSFNFLQSSTASLTAQALGRREENEIRSILMRAFLLAWIVGLLLLCLEWPLANFGLPALGAKDRVLEAALVYLGIRILSAPCQLAIFAMLGSLVGLGRTGLCFVVATFLNCLNVIASALLVLVFDFGIAGIAWGTVIAEVSAMFLAGSIHIFLHRNRGWPRLGEVLRWEKIKQLMAINSDIMIRSFVLILSFSFFARQGALAGEIILAANAVLMHFFLFAGYFLDGVTSAAHQLAGRTLGARSLSGFRKTFRLSLVWGFALAGVASLLYAALGPFIIDLITTNAEVRLTARDYLVWAVLTPLVGTLAFQMDGIFLGATWSQDLRNMMLLSGLLYLVAWAALTPFWGNHGLWIAILIFLGARGVTLLIRAFAKMRTEPAFER